MGNKILKFLCILTILQIYIHSDVFFTYYRNHINQCSIIHHSPHTDYLMHLLCKITLPTEFIAVKNYSPGW